jgi:hypothetical protein
MHMGPRVTYTRTTTLAGAAIHDIARKTKEVTATNMPLSLGATYIRG